MRSSFALVGHGSFACTRVTTGSSFALVGQSHGMFTSENTEFQSVFGWQINGPRRLGDVPAVGTGRVILMALLVLPYVLDHEY